MCNNTSALLESQIANRLKASMLGSMLHRSYTDTLTWPLTYRHTDRQMHEPDCFFVRRSAAQCVRLHGGRGPQPDLAGLSA